MKRMEVIQSVPELFLNMHLSIAYNWNPIPQCTISYILIRQIIPYHSTQHNFYSVCKDCILKNEYSHCRCVVNFVSLPFFFEMFETLLCTIEILFKFHSIQKHSIAYHQTFCSKFSSHTNFIAQHSINISQHSIKL